MTVKDLIERRQSDKQAADVALDLGILDSFSHELRIEQIEDKFFDDLQFFGIIPIDQRVPALT